MPRTIAWKDMPEEWKADQLKKARVRKYLRQTGRGSDIPIAQVRAWVTRLHDEGGMSFQAIADAAGGGLNNSTVSDLYRANRSGSRARAGGTIKSVRRKTHNLLMAVELPVTEAEDSLAMVDACGTRRRLQALAYAGFGALATSELTGRDHKHTWRDMHGKSSDGTPQKHVTVATRRVYREFYEKYIHADPADFDINALSISRAKGMAARYNWAPEHCWDDDSIDDPDAFPEWTGECGTMAGYYLHLKYDILVEAYSDQAGTKPGKQKRKVLCQACLRGRMEGAAAAGLSTPGPLGLSFTGIDELSIADSLKAGQSHAEIAAEHGCSTRTVQRVSNRLKDTGEWTPHTTGPRKKAAA